MVILYGSAAVDRLTPRSDIDVICFVSAERRYPDPHRWSGFMIDSWIHPLADAGKAEDFLRLHHGRVLLDHNGTGQDLLKRVVARVSQPRIKLAMEEERHRKAWVWKMFDRVTGGGVEADHRRHWLFHDLLEIWCELTARHYLGPADAFKQMQTESPLTYAAVEAAMKPQASMAEIERALTAVAGPRDSLPD